MKYWQAPVDTEHPAVTFTLWQSVNGGEPTKIDTVTIDEGIVTKDKAESVTFAPQPSISPDDKTYTYTVTEGAVAGFTKVDNAELEAQYIFTNRIDPADVIISGTKTWEGVPENVTLPESITVELRYPNNEPVKDAAPVTTTADQDWAYSFTVTDGMYNDENGLYTDYVVREVGADGKILANNSSVTLNGQGYKVSYNDVVRAADGHLTADITNTYENYTYRINQHYTVITNNVRGTTADVLGEVQVGEAGATITVSDEDIANWKIYGNETYAWVANSGNTSVKLSQPSAEPYEINLYYELTKSSTTPINPPTPGGDSGPSGDPGDTPYYPPSDTPSTVLPENNPPLAPAAPVDIAEPEVPLANEPEEVIIPAEPVPLSDNPKTGTEKQRAAQAGMAALLLMAGAMLIHDLKRKPE